MLTLNLFSRESNFHRIIIVFFYQFVDSYAVKGKD
jgi:hypothetical protein